jgi:hypothetical protein
MILFIILSVILIKNDKNLKKLNFDLKLWLKLIFDADFKNQSNFSVQ